MTYEEQLSEWAAGRPIHGNCCVPDFSCCKPELLQPEEVRRAFVACGEEERVKFLFAFLGAAFDKIHIAGRGEGDA